MPLVHLSAVQVESLSDVGDPERGPAGLHKVLFFELGPHFTPQAVAIPKWALAKFPSNGGTIATIFVLLRGATKAGLPRLTIRCQWRHRRRASRRHRSDHLDHGFGLAAKGAVIVITEVVLQ